LRQRLRAGQRIEDLAKVALLVARTGAGDRNAQTLEDREKEQLRKRVAELEQLVGRQTAEIDFFKGALRRIEERRQINTGTGGAASTSKSR
jgi:hypothetical protein